MITKKKIQFPIFVGQFVELVLVVVRVEGVVGERHVYDGGFHLIFIKDYPKYSQKEKRKRKQKTERILVT